MKKYLKLVLGVLVLILIIAFTMNYKSQSPDKDHADTTNNYNPNIQISVRLSSDNEFLKKVPLSLNELKANLKESIFEIQKHPVYPGKNIKYLGFDFKEVVKLIESKLNLQNSEQYLFSLWASDNFSSFVSTEDLATGRAFLAWREVHGGDENKSSLSDDGLWTLVDKHGSPGPFYLVWDNPEKTYWQKWPFKIAEITLISKEIATKFDSLAPPDDFVLTKGYKLILKNCTSCHHIAGVGFGQMSADLTDLVHIRNEDQFLSQVRKPMGRMVAFDPSILSDDDVKAIYVYLKSIPVN